MSALTILSNRRNGTIRILMAGATLLGTFLLLSTAARAETVANQSQGVTVVFESDDPGGCLQHYVGGFKNSTKVRGAAGELSTGAVIYISRGDTSDCASATSFTPIASGITTSGVQLHLGPRLRTATLRAMIPVTFDSDTIDYTVDLTWEGTVDQLFVHRSVGPQTAFPGSGVSHYTQMQRPAQAIGTLSDGTTNFATNPSAFGSLDSSSGLQVIKSPYSH